MSKPLAFASLHAQPRSRRFGIPLALLTALAVVGCDLLFPPTPSSQPTDDFALTRITTPTVSPARTLTTAVPAPSTTMASAGDGRCPVSDQSFCAFVRELEPLIETSDIDAILRKTLQYDCRMEGGAGPGWDPDRDCAADAFCSHWGALQAEGSCTPLSHIAETWRSNASDPLSIRGLVYPSLPGLETNEILGGPAILVATGDPKWDWILFTRKTGDQWSVSAVLMQRKAAARYQTPDEIVIPWP